MFKKNLALLILMSFSFASTALEINNEESYIVKKGDTLWDISNHFFKDPWEWKTLWSYNTQIENPHLIYPDDLIKLVYKNGEPKLMIEKARVFNLNNGINKKTYRIGDNIPYINFNKIIDFESKYKTSERLDNQIIKSKKSNLISKSGDVVYFTFNKQLDKKQVLNIYKEKDLVHSSNNVVLYEKIGSLSNISKQGDVYEGEILYSSTAINSKDVLEIAEEKEIRNIYPSKPPKETKVEIIHTLDKINASKNDILILNKGSGDGLKVGNILKVKSQDEEINFDNKKLKITGKEKAIIFVFKVSESFSQAIVLKNDFLIKKGDNAYYPLDEVK